MSRSIEQVCEYMRKRYGTKALQVATETAQAQAARNLTDGYVFWLSVMCKLDAEEHAGVRNEE